MTSPYAHPGNQHGVALKDPAVRQKAYDDFCEHLAKGKSIKSWWYEDNEGHSCYFETMLSYIKKNPAEFCPLKKKIAETKGFNRWEDVVEKTAEGKNKEGSVPGLQMLMRNKYGWDKEQSKQVVINLSDLQQALASDEPLQK